MLNQNINLTEETVQACVANAVPQTQSWLPHLNISGQQSNFNANQAVNHIVSKMCANTAAGFVWSPVQIIGNVMANNNAKVHLSLSNIVNQLGCVVSDVNSVPLIGYNRIVMIAPSINEINTIARRMNEIQNMNMNMGMSMNMNMNKNMNCTVFVAPGMNIDCPQNVEIIELTPSSLRNFMSQHWSQNLMNQQSLVIMGSDMAHVRVADQICNEIGSCMPNNCAMAIMSSIKNCNPIIINSNQENCMINSNCGVNSNNVQNIAQAANASCQNNIANQQVVNSCCQQNVASEQIKNAAVQQQIAKKQITNAIVQNAVAQQQINSAVTPQQVLSACNQKKIAQNQMVNACAQQKVAQNQINNACVQENIAQKQIVNASCQKKVAQNQIVSSAIFGRNAAIRACQILASNQMINPRAIISINHSINTQIPSDIFSVCIGNRNIPGSNVWLNNCSPMMVNCSPMMDNCSPMMVNGSSMMMDNCSPMMDNCSPMMMNNCSPMMVNSSSMMVNGSSMMDNCSPMMDNCSPMMMNNCSPMMDSCSPMMMDRSQMMDSCSPMMNNNCSPMMNNMIFSANVNSIRNNQVNNIECQMICALSNQITSQANSVMNMINTIPNNNVVLNAML